MSDNTKIPRVFISSTFRDLQEYRQAAFRAIHSLGGYSDDMIYWSADERDGATHSVDRVKQSDILVLLLAHRYGYIPEGSPYSVTESEYHTAKQMGIPVLAFFVDSTIPWPPNFVEWERREELDRFKKRVESEVTRKEFKSPDELFALVTQALAQFREKFIKESGKANRLNVNTVPVDSAFQLRSKPNALLPIGTAEDGLPLVLQIQRAKDLSFHLNKLAELVTSPTNPPPEALLKTFQQSLEEYALSAWTSENIHPVKLPDGSSEDMYVTNANLTQLFVSLFAQILSGFPEGNKQFKEPTKATVGSVIATAVAASHGVKELQSVGGANRFLGISLKENRVYSVGKQANVWVAWRPFLFESIPANFPSCQMTITGAQTLTASPANYAAMLAHYLQNIVQQSASQINIGVALSRQSVGQVLLKVATALDELHKSGKIHGDLKPANIILTEGQPTLIDSFNLDEGEFAPGWTPTWSAPEQILGEAVTLASDVYPLGRMIVTLLDGHLVGEVRKFKTPPLADGSTEADIFYNPSVYYEPNTTVCTGEGMKSWAAFAKACLQFTPDKRPKLFVDHLRKLLDEHPLSGDIRINLPANLLAITTLDGSEVVANVLTDRAAPFAATDYGSIPAPPPPGDDVFKFEF